MPPPSRRRRARLAALGVGLGLVLAELAIRALHPYPSPSQERQRSWRYQAAIAARHVFPRLAQAHPEPAQHLSAQGYRGRPFAVPRPPAVRRIVVLGGSGAFDVFAADGDDWPSRLERRLHALGHGDVEVVNGGTPGNATWDLLGRLAGEIWMFEPQVVVVYEAWNDIKSFHALTPERARLRRVAPPRFVGADGVLVQWNPYVEYFGPVDRLLCRSQLYLALRTAYFGWRLGRFSHEGRPAERLATAISPWGPRQYELDLRMTVAAARAAGAQPVLVTQARLVAPDNDADARARIDLDAIGLSHAAVLDGFAACDAALRRVAADEGVPLLDASAALSGRPELFVDHVHTTAAGSAALAELIAAGLAPLLASR